MKHIPEEELVLHYYGEGIEGGLVERHLDECAECRAGYNALRLVLNSVDSAAVPERGPEYGGQVWERIAGKLGARPRWWSGLRQPRWWVWVPVTALLLVLAFAAGRFSRRAEPGQVTAGNQVRERILLVAVGDHLERSQMILAELSNAPDGRGKIDISGERAAAEELLDDNRLYRQTAHNTGDTAVAGVLDDLERVLLEIANGPSQVSSGQLEQLRQEIRERGLLFKVRVVDSQIRQRETERLRGPDKSKKGI